MSSTHDPAHVPVTGGSGSGSMVGVSSVSSVAGGSPSGVGSPPQPTTSPNVARTRKPPPRGHDSPPFGEGHARLARVNLPGRQTAGQSDIPLRAHRWLVGNGSG